MVTTPIITSHNNERMKDEVGRERSDISDVASRRRAESFCYLPILSTVAAEPEPAQRCETACVTSIQTLPFLLTSSIPQSHDIR